MASAFGSVPSTAKVQPTPFKIEIPQERVDLLKTLVKHAYVAPETFESRDKSMKYGITQKWLADAKDEWEHKFDWSVYINFQSLKLGAP
jgi:microsomal epoxide hydrolase